MTGDDGKKMSKWTHSFLAAIAAPCGGVSRCEVPFHVTAM
jgi:hypothetical protein